MLFDGVRCWIWQSAKTSTQFTQLVLVRDQVEHLDRRVQRMHFPRDFAGSLRSKRSSFRDTINHLYQVQAHSYVDDSRYLCSSQ
jgi:hypothetical protein